MNSDDEKLSHLLRTHEPDYLQDDGFTARVLAQLPPPRTQSSLRRRRVILLCSALLACVLCAMVLYPALKELMGPWGVAFAREGAGLTWLGQLLPFVSLIVAALFLVVWMPSYLKNRRRFP